MKNWVEKEIMSKQTPNGGWTKKQMVEWKVPWPRGKSVPHGWKELMVKHETLSYVEAMNREMDQECDEARDRK